jgi:hypothetical protein
MVWFKVDDAFDDHPKALAAGNAAIGLWTRCGAYSSRYLLEGFVPAEVARIKGTKAEIARLVTVGLWREVDGGYQMHDFLDYNPSEELTKARRAKTAKRVAEWRERRNGDGGNGVTGELVTLPPTRPDPTLLTSRSLTTSNPVTRPVGSEDDLNGPTPPNFDAWRPTA